MAFRLEIVTPDAQAYSDEVDFVVLPAVEGEMGVYPMHVPLMTQIHPGELVVTKRGQTEYLAVGEGFVEITQTGVRVLADMAIEEKSIDVNAAEDAIKRAQDRLAAEDLGSEEVAAVQAAIQKSMAQVTLKRRRRG